MNPEEKSAGDAATDLVVAVTADAADHDGPVVHWRSLRCDSRGLDHSVGDVGYPALLLQLSHRNAATID